MAKKAVVVGINYPGTSYALKGCVNDALAMQKLLKSHFGFQNIKLLLDGDATASKIKNALKSMVLDAKSGDILFFHYSGHGSQVPDNKDADYEPDGLDEIICPVDLNWADKMIRDDELKQIFDKLPAGVNLTVVLDSCNSGGGLDQLNEYKPLGGASKREISIAGKYLPPPPEIAAVVAKLKFKKVRTLTSRDIDKVGLLISGCETNQTSADAYINGKYMGAATYMCIEVLKSHSFTCTYKQLVDDMNQQMVKHKFTQRPELNGSKNLFSYNFLSPMGKSDVIVDNSSTESDKPVRPKPTCKRCHLARKRCKCPKWWKRYYWKSGLWRIGYRQELRQWRRLLAQWKRDNV